MREFFMSNSNKLVFEANKKIEKMNYLKFENRLLLLDLNNEKKIVKINKVLLNPIDFSVLNSNYKIKDKNDKAKVAKDLVLNFKVHFALKLKKNFQTFLFNKKIEKFMLKIKAVKILLKLYSLKVFRNLSKLVINKIIKLQKAFKLRTFTKYLLQKLVLTKKVVKFKLKHFYNRIVSHIKIKNKIFLNLKAKVINLNKNIFTKTEKLFVQSIRSRETTRFSSASKYYNNKIIIKILYLLSVNK